MNKLLVSALLSITLFGCSKYEYWDISQFNMQPNALEDGEEIKLIYTSQGPDYNRDLKYYIHLIAVSQKTGDTVNILVTGNNGLKDEDGDKIFNYFNADNPVVIMGEMDPDEIPKAGTIDSLKNMPRKIITKVARDPEFDDIAHNHYPTVIGGIGTLTQNAVE
ncbi:MAG: hypothetical protein V4613_08965 [Bacteroidota bacterium]